MREIVTYLKFHSADAFIPGLGVVGTTLPNNTKSMDIIMHYTQGDVVIRTKINGKTVLIPLGSVQLFLTSPDPDIFQQAVKLPVSRKQA